MIATKATSMLRNLLSRKRPITTYLSVWLLTLGAWSMDVPEAMAKNAAFDWRSNWGVKRDFAVHIDTEGYQMPSAIAFVPNPGTGPKDPLYFVTELRGKVKVVTHDRTVHTFAADFFRQFLPPPDLEELPHRLWQGGLAGICLAPQYGYVFVTFLYEDAKGVFRNNLVRFETTPNTFSTRATAAIAFTEIFSDHESGPAHQIGQCQIHDELLYISVADGWSTHESQNLDTTLGKVLRMTLDGKPVPSNPFYRDDDVKKSANYVWAYGLRNPFGLHIAHGQVFASENGPKTDRFLEIRQGENYLWDGSAWSMATNALAVFTPSVAPVHVAYLHPTSTAFPAMYHANFFVALAGEIGGPGPGGPGQQKGILTFKYGVNERKLLSPPAYFLQYIGKGFQVLTGVAFGPDGLYFSALLPDEAGRSPIYKITHDPAAGYPFRLDTEQIKPSVLIRNKGCVGCHQLDDGYGGTAGPALIRQALIQRVQKRLNSPQYRQSVQALDRLDTEPYRSYRDVRNRILDMKGLEQIRTWVTYRILEPKFDNTSSLMPNLGLTEAEATTLANFLVREEPSKSLLRYLKWEGPLRRRHVLFSFAGGCLIGGLSLSLSRWTRRKPK